jgi:hypothetical protein
MNHVAARNSNSGSKRPVVDAARACIRTVHGGSRENVGLWISWNDSPQG